MRVSVSYISAERFWDQDKPSPAGVRISTNVNIVGFEQKNDKLAVPFVVTIAYVPSIAQINIKGQAFISGSSDEVEKLREGYNKRTPPPPMLLRAITNATLVDATIISKTLNIPPPIPLPGLPTSQKQDNDRPSYVG